jgi:hypothetical protein
LGEEEEGSFVFLSTEGSLTGNGIAGPADWPVFAAFATLDVFIFCIGGIYGSTILSAKDD